MEAPGLDSGIRLADLLAAFSLATDLGLGQPMEHVLRSWRIAAALAERTGLADGQAAALFYVAMLAWVGCVADTPEVAASFGDDIDFRAASYDVDLGGLSGMGFFLARAASGKPPLDRIRAMTRLVATGGKQVQAGIRSHCLTTSTMAEQLGLDAEVQQALLQFFTRWDGRGVPARVGGTDIVATMRLFHLADVVEVHHRLHGVVGAVEVARARRGRQFDPAVVDAFCAVAEDVLTAVAEPLDPRSLIADEAVLGRSLTQPELDAALEVLADFTDLRSLSRGGHSRAVAELAAAAASSMGLPAADVTAVRRAALVHDVGLHGVPSTILDKPGPLTATEWERVRLSAYYTERVLARPSTLARLGAIASRAHERMDGSGYHRGLTRSGIPVTARVLAAACAYRALCEPRAHRPAHAASNAVALLRDEVRAGRQDPQATDAVLAAAGTSLRRRVTGPAGLTPREVEVLILIARGASTQQAARLLGIAPKTAGTHVERIYLKTGASSRSTATLFALRHGLIDALEA